jgi:hypothetical protein
MIKKTNKLEQLNTLEESKLIELHNTYNQTRIFYVDLRFKYMNYYTGIFTALLSGIIYIFITHQNKYSLLICMILIGGLYFAIILSNYAIDMNNRCYKILLENIVLIGKIENLLGLNMNINCEKRTTNNIFWKDDSSFMIDRYIEDRKHYNLSKDFIANKLEDGANKKAKQQFQTFKKICYILMFIAIIKYLLSKEFIELLKCLINI